MADIQTIREGLARNLSSIRDVQVSAYMLAAPTPPCIHVFPSTIEFDRGMHRGLDIVAFDVQAFVAFGLDQGGQMRLDEMLAPSGFRSVKQAIESDRTLGSMVDDVWVVRLDRYRAVILPDQNDHVLEATWLVNVNNASSLT